MNYKNLWSRLLLLISSPAKAWEEIRLEDSRNVLGTFVYPLIGLCGLATFLGDLSTDWQSARLQQALSHTCSLLIALFGGYFSASYLVHRLTVALLRREAQLLRCRQFVGYSMAVLFVLYIVSGLFPGFFVLRWLLQFYTVYVVWEGADKLMEVEEPKMLSYSLSVSAVVIALPIALEWLFNYLSITLN